MSSEAERAGEFEQLFRAVYLTFHRRDGPRSQLPGASAAVLEHLALAGPLTIGEAAAHLRRAQSVVSEIVAHLERQGLLEREADPADRRRTLIWLTAAGHASGGRAAGRAPRPGPVRGRAAAARAIPGRTP